MLPSDDLPLEPPLKGGAESSVGRPPLLAESVAVFAPGQWLRVDGTICHVVTVVGGRVEFEHLGTKERRWTTIAKLKELRFGVDLNFIPPPNTTQEMLELVAQDEALRSRVLKLPLDGKTFATLMETVIRIKWVQALRREHFGEIRARDLWDPDICAIAKKYDLPVRTARTLAKWAAQDRDADLLPNYDRRGGKGQARIDGRAADVIGTVISEAREPTSSILLTPTDILTEVSMRIAAANLLIKTGERPIPCPSLSTAGRMLAKSVTPYELSVARIGKSKTKRMFTPSGRRPTIDFPGGVSEFDDLDTKVFCVDERTGLPWGHPWLTQGVDQASGYPVGISMDNKPRSAVSAVSALVHSIEFKVMANEDPENSHLQWDAFGYPTSVLFDNALYNNPRIVSLNADVSDASWAQPFQPRQKRQVEYVNGLTVSGFLKHEKGYRGAFDDPDALKDGLRTAIWAINLFKRRHLIWLLAVYANRPSKDGTTPLQRYVEDQRVRFRSLVPPDTRRLRLLRMLQLPKKLRWSGGGIRTLGLTFQDVDQFKKWINRSGGSMHVYVRIDPDDLNAIFVTVPDSDYCIEIPCLEQAYVRGLTLYQHKMILQMCKQLKKSHPALADMYAGREELRKLTSQLMHSGRVRERKKANRTGELPATPAPASEKEAVSDLEHECEELASTEMDPSAEGWEMPVMN